MFELLDRLGYPYVVMLPSDTFGHTQMVAEHSEKIRWRVPYAVGEKGLFGISERKRLFGQHPEEAFINLFFDASNGSQRALTLIAKIQKATREIQAQIQKGKKPVVPPSLKKYISLRELTGSIISGMPPSRSMLYSRASWAMMSPGCIPHQASRTSSALVLWQLSSEVKS